MSFHFSFAEIFFLWQCFWTLLEFLSPVHQMTAKNKVIVSTHPYQQIPSIENICNRLYLCLFCTCTYFPLSRLGNINFGGIGCLSFDIYSCNMSRVTIALSKPSHNTFLCSTLDSATVCFSFGFRLNHS